jgi:hypothetical protein
MGHAFHPRPIQRILFPGSVTATTEDLLHIDPPTLYGVCLITEPLNTNPEAIYVPRNRLAAYIIYGAGTTPEMRQALLEGMEKREICVPLESSTVDMGYAFYYLYTAPTQQTIDFIRSQNVFHIHKNCRIDESRRASLELHVVNVKWDDPSRRSMLHRIMRVLPHRKVRFDADRDIYHVFVERNKSIHRFIDRINHIPGVRSARSQRMRKQKRHPKGYMCTPSWKDDNGMWHCACNKFTSRI